MKNIHSEYSYHVPGPVKFWAGIVIRSRRTVVENRLTIASFHHLSNKSLESRKNHRKKSRLEIEKRKSQTRSKTSEATVYPSIFTTSVSHIFLFHEFMGVKSLYGFWSAFVCELLNAHNARDDVNAIYNRHRNNMRFKKMEHKKAN